MDGGFQSEAQPAAVEGAEARNWTNGVQPGGAMNGWFGTLTPVALRAPSVRAPEELSILP